jgi:two-component system KDP operon response regulator KdpE
VDDTGHAGAPHVLVVEDNSLVSDAMRILFEASGSRVSVAGSVAEALRVSGEDPADLVLLDLTLPDGDGLDVVAGYRAREGAHPSVFVALTGRDDAATHDRCIAAGCRDVLVKPVPARELVARSRAWLPG